MKLSEKSKRKNKGLLTGKYALITGGFNGIGLAIVKEFLEQGAKVLCWDIDRARAGAFRHSFLDSVKKGQLKIDVVDISDKKEVEKVFGMCNWPIDVLVNNAGIDEPYSLEDPDDTIWQKIININLDGTKNVTKVVVNRMLRRKIKGSIIFITSIHTLQAFPGGSAYDASKHGMLGLMKVLALEYGRYGIRSNAIAPGCIHPTGITAGLSQKQKRIFSEKIPLGKLGKPEDIAKAAVFLASEDMASYISGTQLVVDGGLIIKSALF